MELGAFYPFSRNHNSIENFDQVCVTGLIFRTGTTTAVTLPVGSCGHGARGGPRLRQGLAHPLRPVAVPVHPVRERAPGGTPRGKAALHGVPSGPDHVRPRREAVHAGTRTDGGACAGGGEETRAGFFCTYDV